MVRTRATNGAKHAVAPAVEDWYPVAVLIGVQEDLANGFDDRHADAEPGIDAGIAQATNAGASNASFRLGVRIAAIRFARVQGIVRRCGRADNSRSRPPRRVISGCKGSCPSLSTG